MNMQWIRTLYDYHYWANQKVWDCVVPLSEAQSLKPFDYSIGTIRDQLVHMMSAEAIWFTRIAGESPSRMLDPADFPSLTSIQEQWSTIEQHVRHTIATLTDADLARPMAYQRTGGSPQSTPLVGILLHVVNHGTDHRAQVLQLINRVGGQSVEQDLIFYLRAQRL